MFKLLRLTLIAVALLLAMATGAQAQEVYGQRLVSRDGQWVLPVASRLLGSDEGDHLGRGSINAWDLSASVGTPVFAAAAGTISYVDCYGYEQGRSSFHQGYGCAVDVSHGGGIVSQYAHCAEKSFMVQVGQSVGAWTQLCKVGMTGSTSWPHLHFDILHNGSAIRLDGIFDKGQMDHQKFKRASNDPNAPIVGLVGGAGQQVRQAVQAQPATRLQGILATIAQADPDEAGRKALLALVIVIVGLYLAPGWLRIAVTSAIMSVTCVAVFLWLMEPVSATPSAAPVGAGWENAYRVVIGEEGNSCTTDPVLTMGGVTQTTYNRWRAKSGLGPAHVCVNLREDQRQQIFYEFYWLESGADRLPPSLALTAVDFGFNAGVGRAKEGIAQCGADVKCFNDFREQFYRSASLCRLYCTGWINRLNRIRQMTEGKQQ